MVAQQMALDRPWIFRRMILVGTAPRAGEDVMHLEKPRLGRYLADPKLQGYAVLTKLLFELTESSQAAGEAFVSRLTQRNEDLDPPSGPNVAAAQMAAFREWERFTGTRFARSARIPQPTLVVNGIHDEMNFPSSPHAGRHQGGLRLQSMPTLPATTVAASKLGLLGRAARELQTAAQRADGVETSNSLASADRFRGQHSRRT